MGLRAPVTSAPPVWRRLFHLTVGSSIPFLAIFVNSTVMVALMAVLCGLALLVEVARLRLPRLNGFLVKWLRPFLKEVEDRRLTGATYIAISALVAFLVFDKEVAIVALFFLSLGDPAAALVGGRMGGVRLVGKSPWGSLAFFGVSLAVAGVLSGTGALSYHWGIVVGAAVAALVELVPFVLDDNLTIPLIAGAAMTAAGV